MNKDEPEDTTQSHKSHKPKQLKSPAIIKSNE